jgi:hypothetical protein
MCLRSGARPVDCPAALSSRPSSLRSQSYEQIVRRFRQRNETKRRILVASHNGDRRCTYRKRKESSDETRVFIRININIDLDLPSHAVGSGRACAHRGAIKARCGSSAVYSARVRGPVDPNREGFGWRDVYRKNGFLYGLSHQLHDLHRGRGILARSSEFQGHERRKSDSG